MKKRFFWADIIRCSAIFFVVVNHNFFIPSTNIFATTFALVTFTFVKTAIPLFIMLSGALLLTKDESLKIFFKKRISKVVFPWIIWTFIFMAFNYYFHNQQLRSLSEFKYTFELTFFTQLWFLPLIVGIYLFTPIWRIFVKNCSDTILHYFIILWFILTSFVPYVHQSVTFPLNGLGFFYQALLYSGYFVLGYAVIMKRIPTFSKKVLSFLFLFGVIWTTVDYHYFHLPEKTFDYLSPNIFLCSFSLFMFIHIIFDKKKYEKSKLHDLLTNISIASLGIYIIHQPITELLRPHFSQIKNFLISIDATFFALLIGIVYFVISFIIVLIIRKLPKGKLLLP